VTDTNLPSVVYAADIQRLDVCGTDRQDRLVSQEDGAKYTSFVVDDFRIIVE
jgi:hypothetical protein